MLKIKDNIDLKELEKYGFIKDTYGDFVKELKANVRQCQDYKNSIMVDGTHHIGKVGFVVQDIEEKKGYCLDEELITLYDLIKYDLVEKVDD